MNAYLKDNDGFHLYGWMVNNLDLEAGDLLAFALVFSFTKGHAGEYTGNTAYLSAWTGWSEKTCRAHLANLVSRGLIVEVRGRDNNSPFCHYKLSPNFYEKHPEKITGSPGKNFPESTRKKLPEEKNNNINISRIEFNPPTPLEVSHYCEERGWTDPAGFAQHFIDYYTQAGWHLSNGKPMKDWKKAVITWEPNNKFRSFAGSPSPRSAAPSPKKSREDQAFANMVALGKKLGFVKQQTPAYDEQ